MARRLVEYLVTAGVRKSRLEKEVNSDGSFPDVKGVVLQRFPTEDRKEAPLPGGFEIFCQPMGWHLTSTPEPPYYINFILTAEDSSRLFCSALNFHQLHKPAPKTIRRHVALSMHGKVPTEKNRPHSRSVDYYLDEENEAHWTPDAVVIQQEDIYEPFSLALVSKFPLFETLQACLKAVYVSWISSGQSSGHSIEPLIASLLGSITVPEINCLPIRRPFGLLKELVLHPIDEASSLPYSSTCTITLLKSIGVHNLLSLVAAVLSDISILILSSSYTALTFTVQAIWSLLFPLKITHSLVPVVPAALLDYVQLPSTYIMGVHSSLKRNIGELPDVVVVDLDDGHISVPSTVVLQHLPDQLGEVVEDALAEVLHPSIKQRDYVFTQDLNESRSLEIQDREVRAVFLCLFVHLLADYQEYVTVIRFHPHPAFAFRKDNFLAKHAGGEIQNLVHKITDSIAFINFTHERPIPYRQCDFFDELVVRYTTTMHSWTLTKLFSRTHIQQLAQEIMKLLPIVEYGANAFNLSTLNKDHLDTSPRRFPVLSQDLMEKSMDSSSDTVKLNRVEETNCRTVPLLDCPLPSEFQKYHSGVVKELEMLRNCLDAVFRDNVLEARKYLPSVIAALGSHSITTALYPELVYRVLKFGALMNSEQYDMIVKIMNSALNDREEAAVLLPLVIIIYREVKPGVQQELSTSVQNHHIWCELEFWKNAFFVAVQAELVRVYAEQEVAKMAKISEETTNEIIETDEPDIYTQRSRERLKSASARCVQPSSKTLLVLSRSAKIRMKASVPIPNLAEGILPPESQPVTTEEALHHLAKRLKLWPSLTESEKITVAQQEENAVQNQLVLFINRIIALRTPLEVAAGEEDQRSLEEFIGKFLKSVESNLCFEFSNYGKIKDLINVSIESYSRAMSELRNDLKKQPIVKRKMIKPPLLKGESFKVEGVHCYLVQDGRDNGLLLPAEGHIFVTSYRVIFMGIPSDPQAPNVIITRSAPISSIFRLKKLPPIQLNSLGLMTTGGLQLRTLTAELIKLGFTEDMSQLDQQQLFEQLIDYRHRPTITLGLTYPQDPAQAAPADSVAADIVVAAKATRTTQSHSADLRLRNETTRIKLHSALLQSPCCHEYKRMGLGALVMTKMSGPWRLSDINMQYEFCTSYPAVIAVPNEVTDELLQTISAQFLCKRLPVATWKHPKNNAVLLRSASFQSIATKKISGSNIVNATHAIADNGISHSVVQTYLNNILHITRATVDDNKRLNNTLQSHVSVMPETVEFEKGDISAGDQENAQTVVGNFKSYLPKSGTDATPESSSTSAKSQKANSNATDSEIELNDIVIEGHDGPVSPRAIDWEPLGNTQPGTSPIPAIPEEVDTPDPLSPTGRPDELSLNWQFFPGNAQMKKMSSSSSLTFSSIPTRPRDWVVMHALPKELKHWNASALYVLGNRSALHDIPSEGYPNCTFVPVDAHTLTDVKESFRKLLHCCAPTANQSGYFSGIDDSKWLSQICTIMELAGAVTDLIDIQGSSVLVCLEDGWDITAQVVALAQILLDPHYRTLDGFKALIEKDWLSFGHKFSERGAHTTSHVANVTPIFLQFLDAVHQVLRQFPLSFEFNDFYLQTMAYHHCSMRFHTFCLDSERDRYNNNWLKYRPRPGAHSDSQSHVSYWEYVDEIHFKSPMFYNFKYQPHDAGVPQAPLRPYSFQANLDIWSFYLHNNLSQFHPYDVELICENDLTVLDLHRHFFDQEQHSLALSIAPSGPFDPTTAEVSILMKQCTDLMNTLALKQNLSETLTWLQLFKRLQNQPWYKAVLQPFHPSVNDLQADRHRLAVHKRTSLAVLIKGKVASESLGDVHEFVSCNTNSQDSCNFCNLHILSAQAFQCKTCGCICHLHCKSYMPGNCSPRDGVNAKHEKAPVKATSSAQHSGLLFKKGKIVRSWKQRRFVLDPMKGELSYLEEDRTQGSILLKDITSVEEAEPQPVAGVTKQGFFFNICTPKRVFNLMALAEDERRGWLEKIHVALEVARQHS